MTNYIINNYMTDKKIIRKFSYTCDPNDAIWTHVRYGCGVIIYDLSTATISFNKLWGCNPYWWQFMAAAICSIPPEEYTRVDNRVHPFKVSIKEGSSGALHLYMDTYCKTSSGLYVKEPGESPIFDVSMCGKIADGVQLRFGDLVEFSRALCSHNDMPFSRNPRWWKKGAQAFWRFEKLRPCEVVDEVDYDPDDNNK